jgi:hypothetical protein
MKQWDYLLGQNNKTFISLITTNMFDHNLETSKEYDMACQDCNHSNCSEFNPKKTVDVFDFYPNHPISYKINNFGFRSDDITKESVKDNYVFIGCSNTFGLGVPVDHLWSYQLNSFLKGSSFINMGTRGGNVEVMAYNFFSLVKNFGNPKGVFIDFSNLNRQTEFNGIGKNKHISMTYDRNVANTDLMVFSTATLIMSIEEYCRQAQIPLICSSWDPEMAKVLDRLCDNGDLSSKHFFNQFDIKLLQSAASNNKPDISTSKYWEKSRDGHRNGLEHWVTYEMFKTKFEKSYGL